MDGNETEGFVWAGLVIGLINHIPTVQDLFDEMIVSAEKGLSRLNSII